MRRTVHPTRNFAMRSFSSLLISLGTLGFFGVASFIGIQEASATIFATLNTPTSVSATAPSSSSATVSFTFSDSNFSYPSDQLVVKVYSALTGGTALSYPSGGTGSSSPLTISGLNPSTTYYFTVYANGSGYHLDSSESSPRASATTAAASSGSTTLGGTVVTIPRCFYAISGVPGSISLTGSTYNPDVTTGSTSLTGTAAGLTASAFPDAGNPFNASCSFYNSSSQNPTVKASIASIGWTTSCSPCASGASSFTWNVGSTYNSSTSPLSVGVTPITGSGAKLNDCANNGGGANPWTLSSSTNITSTSAVNIMSSVNTKPLQCDSNVVISSLIPYGNIAPNGQANYSVTGPTITFTLITS